MSAASLLRGLDGAPAANVAGIVADAIQLLCYRQPIDALQNFLGSISYLRRSWPGTSEFFNYALITTVLVRAGGLEPPQTFRPYGFSYQLRLSPPRVRGFVVWTIPSP